MSSDRFVAIIIFAIAVVYVRQAGAYHGVTVADVVGPSAYPILLGGLMALLAVLQFVRAQPSEARKPFWKRHGRPLLLTGSLVAYVYLLEPLGFLASTFAYLTLSHLWLGERAWPRAVAVGLGITMILWFVFDRTLDLRLPAGILGLAR